MYLNHASRSINQFSTHKFIFKKTSNTLLAAIILAATEILVQGHHVEIFKLLQAFLGYILMLLCFLILTCVNSSVKFKVAFKDPALKVAFNAKKYLLLILGLVAYDAILLVVYNVLFGRIRLYFVCTCAIIFMFLIITIHHSGSVFIYWVHYSFSLISIGLLVIGIGFVSVLLFVISRILDLISKKIKKNKLETIIRNKLAA